MDVAPKAISGIGTLGRAVLRAPSVLAKNATHYRIIVDQLRYHWPNGVVPYTIDAAFTSTERAAIASGINHIHENSCVRSLKDQSQF